MVDSFKKVDNWKDYTFGCPEGTWLGRLDKRGWGKSANLILYFTHVETGDKYWFSLYFNTDYKPRGGGPNFKTEVQEGDTVLLTTKLTASGKPNLVEAKKQ